MGPVALERAARRPRLPLPALARAARLTRELAPEVDQAGRLAVEEVEGAVGAERSYLCRRADRAASGGPGGAGGGCPAPARGLTLRRPMV